MQPPVDTTTAGAAGAPPPRAWSAATLEVVERALAAIRGELGLEVAYLTEFVGDEQVIQAAVGNAAAFGLTEGTAVELEGSYCLRVLDGRLASVVPDTAQEPEVRDLAVTREANLGAYVGVPVRFADGALYGTLCAADTTAAPGLADRDVSFMGVFARMLADAIEREGDHDRRHAAQAAAGAAKSRFISNLSHEVRTPLNAILVLADLLEREGLRPEHVDHVQRIRQAGRHLLALLSDTLDLARVEAGRLPVSVRQVDTSAVLADAVAILAGEASARGTRVLLAPQPGPVAAMADPDRLRQCVLNLLSNAIKYGGGAVTVGCAGGAGEVEITVRDDGPGIPPEQAERLFTAYDRLDADRGPEQGSGIGLALTRDLVNLMGGSIDVVSDAASGTCFTIRLAAAPSAPPAALAAPPAEGPATGRPVRVLCVDDDMGSVHLAVAVLADRADVVAVTDGSQAVARAVTERPDVVLLDVRIGEVDGLEVLARLRELDETRDIPVVLVSGETSAGVLDRARGLGVEGVLTKPWSIEELLAVVAAAAPAP